MKEDAIQALHAMSPMVIPWSTIRQWIRTYGLPVVEQLLVALLPILLSGKVDPQAISAWAVAAVQAIANGQPVPSYPLPAQP